MAFLYTPHFAYFTDDNGEPLAGGKLYTYESGTTTPKATYTDNTGGTPNANPVVLDAYGRATIFLDGSYKFVLKDADDNTISGGTTDNVTAFATSTSVTGAADITPDILNDEFIMLDASNGDALSKSALPIASQAEAEAGTATNRLMTPQRTIETMAAFAPVQTVKTDTYVNSASDFAEVTGLTVDATTTNATQKVLVRVMASVAQNFSTDNTVYVKLTRDGTDILVGDAAGSRERVTASITNGTADQTAAYIEFLDSPGAAGTYTYAIEIKGSNGGDAYINRSHTDTDSATYGRTASTITAQVFNV